MGSFSTVTTAIGRPAKFVAVLAAAAALLAGCGSGPSKVNAAAIIGGRTISVDDIQSRVEKVRRDSKFAQQLQEQHKLDLLSRSILTREVSYELTAKAARHEGLTVDEGKLAERMAARPAPQEAPAEAVEANLEQATDSAFDVRDVVRNEMLNEALAKKVVGKLSVTMDIAIVGGTDAKREAEKLAKQMAADPAKAKDLIAQAGQEIARPLPFTDLSLTQAVQLATEQGVDLASSPIYSAPAKSVVTFALAPYALNPQLDVGNQWIVALIKERKDTAPSAAPAAAQPDPPEVLLARIGKRLAGQYIGEINVEISPRYGVWDPVGNAVAPRPEEAIGAQYPARVEKP